MRFALLGAAGYIAPRHMKAIAEVGGELVAACDPHDSVGILDRYSPDCAFFTETERFDRYLEKLRARNQGIDYLVVCTPNYLHDAHCRLGLRLGADVVCEKPVAVKPWNVDQLIEQESRYGKRIYSILQLRLHPALTFKVSVDHQVVIDYRTPRGRWYASSWKGDDAKSGGVLMNIGVHLFDLVLSLFGPCTAFHVYDRMNGMLELDKANVVWRLSTDAKERPLRRLIVDQRPVDLTTGFDDLHTESYRRILEGRGFGLNEAKPAITLIHEMKSRSTPV